MSVMDYEAELQEIEAAITAILQVGQSYTLNTGGGSRQVTYANYNELVKRKNELRTMIAGSRGGLGGRMTAGW